MDTGDFEEELGSECANGRSVGEGKSIRRRVCDLCGSRVCVCVCVCVYIFSCAIVHIRVIVLVNTFSAKK